MQPDTEELFKQWLKIQIASHRMTLISRILFWVIIIASIVSFYLYAWPFLKQFMGSAMNIMEQYGKTTGSLNNQQDLFKSLQDQFLNQK